MTFVHRIGTVLFWLAWPIIHISVRLQPRTRVLVVCKKEVLVVMDLIGPGRWSLPGGGMYRRESAVDGAVRELREETGIAVEPSELQYKGSQETINDEKHRYRYEYFVLELQSKPPITRQKTELRDLQWIPYRQLLADSRTGSVARQHVLAWFDH